MAASPDILVAALARYAVNNGIAAPDFGSMIQVLDAVRFRWLYQHVLPPTDQEIYALGDQRTWWDGYCKDLQADAQQWSPLDRAKAQTLLDAINVERARHGAAAYTLAQFAASVRAKL